jgi:hypothetical protein
MSADHPRGRRRGVVSLTRCAGATPPHPHHCGGRGRHRRRPCLRGLDRLCQEGRPVPLQPRRGQAVPGHPRRRLLLALAGRQRHHRRAALRQARAPGPARPDAQRAGRRHGLPRPRVQPQHRRPVRAAHLARRQALLLLLLRPDLVRRPRQRHSLDRHRVLRDLDVGGPLHQPRDGERVLQAPHAGRVGRQRPPARHDGLLDEHVDVAARHRPRLHVLLRAVVVRAARSQGRVGRRGLPLVLGPGALARRHQARDDRRRRRPVAAVHRRHARPRVVRPRALPRAGLRRGAVGPRGADDPVPERCRARLQSELVA